MNPLLKNILAVVAGIMLGSMVNMGIIAISGSIIPPPEGTDLSTTEGLKNAMPLFGPQHFLFSFLAHALGTFFGAFVTAMFAASNRMKLALSVGIFFLLGGIIAAAMLSAPMWFTATDLLFAYLPMAIFGGRLAIGIRGR